jgi:hypothetical protein
MGCGMRERRSWTRACSTISAYSRAAPRLARGRRAWTALALTTISRERDELAGPDGVVSAIKQVTSGARP